MKVFSIIGIFLSLQLVSVEANAARFCGVQSFLKKLTQRSTPYFEAITGKQIENAAHLFPRALPENSKVFHLGSGLMGGDVYRIELVNGKSEVWKMYRSTSDAGKDYEVLRMLEKASQRRGYQGLKIAHPIEYDGQLLRLEYVPGESIGNVEKMKNLSPSSPIVNKIPAVIEDYQKRLRATFQALKEQFPEYVHSMNDGKNRQAYLRGEHGYLKHIVFLHEENVLVNPYTLELTVIDPL